MHRVPYLILRGLEIEGRHHHDAGGWNLTIRRLEMGEGVPLETDPAYWVEMPDDGPLPPAPELPRSQRIRFAYYRRFRSSVDCQHYLRGVIPDAPVCVDLYAGWANPPGGVIPMPKEGEKRLDETHLVVLIDCKPERREFLFRNTWGEDWGANGFGVLPYDYVDQHVFEAWGAYGTLAHEYEKTKRVAGRQDRLWVGSDETGQRVHGFEVCDEYGQDRRAWAFVLEKDGALEIEELYVRPEFRRWGYGRVLAGKVKDLARAKRLPLRLWVAFADSRQEAPGNYPALLAVVRLLGLGFHPCPVRWAAYYATSERPGAETPVEPERIPPRPRSTLATVMAMALAASSGAETNGTTHPVAVVAPDDDGFPVPGTEAWGVMNRRRGELIRKKIREGLPPDEQREYDRLQRLSLAALERAFPAPTSIDEKLARIEARLAEPADGVPG